MTRTVWLASYPKSGNTWLRMLIANLSATSDEPVDINNLPERGGIASARAPFDHLLLIDSGLLTHDEVDCLRPHVYEELAEGEPDDEYDSRGGDPPVRFVKVHDSYSLIPGGKPLLAGARGADAALVIVRDPRDVAPSLANHGNMSLDEAIAFMRDNNAVFAGRVDRESNQLRQRLLSWSAHVASWLDQTDIPVHLVRYEDMIAETGDRLAQALAFAGRVATQADMDRAVALADFKQLRKQEKEKGFREAPRHGSGTTFFRRGQAGAWQDELTAAQIASIEVDHGPMMIRLGYTLSSQSHRGSGAAS